MYKKIIEPVFLFTIMLMLGMELPAKELTETKPEIRVVK
jgi:hypothetical protein